jgi:segregation and condensation protein A
MSVSSPLSSTSLTVQLDAFEGPLDLLLDLIRRQQIDIYNIPIAQITAQYFDYMQRAAESNIELSAEFVYMAATLIHIKSKLLLPRDPELEKLAPEEDPRKELVDRLLEHESYKNAAEMLQQKRVIEEAVWTNPRMAQFLEEAGEGELAVSLHDLVKTLQKVMDRARLRPRHEVTKEDISVPDMITYLKNVLLDMGRGETISALELFERQRTRRAMICLFLAILEMVRMQALSLSQTDLFDDISLKKGKGFAELVASEEALAAIEEDYS